jgi:hypothetical protein
MVINRGEKGFYTVKKVNNFPVPSRDVTYQTLPGREYLNLGVWEVTSRLGTGKSLTFFYSVKRALIRLL